MGPAKSRLGDLRARDPSATRLLLGAVDAALEAVEPTGLVREALTPAPAGVLVEGELIPARRVMLLAFGKAAAGMARGADQSIGPLISQGLVVTDEAGEVPGWADLIVAGHPIPDRGSVRGAQAAIALAETLAPDDLLLVLVSGGGSALLEAPAEGLSLDDLRELNDRLLQSGAPIEVMNHVRRAVSIVKGGRLGERCKSRLATLVVSDVGSDPAVVASGPTVPPNTPAPDVSEILDSYSITGLAAERARRLATTGMGQPPSGPALILADCFTAGAAATRHLAARGLKVSLQSDALDGPAHETAVRAIASTKEGEVRVLVGETTVEVTGTGRGGRNQHAAVAAGIEIAGSGFRFLAVGTDGVDGPTDAAGGCVDGGTVNDSHSAQRYLDNCDSYSFLEKTGGLLRIGKTGTNVADLWIVDKSG
ncbi:MAG: DUF4147 domain-containing protein [bacterium]|nr:DUF4147 domain-containing protein [bacterium]MDE0289303.1 DUF4147 domain-containing protein [bacterium]MDE0440287.1 DUF4147 domain-containing protein [bacterium]